MNKTKEQPERWVAIKGLKDRVTPDPEYIALKDGVIYETWKTDNFHVTPYSTVGVFRFVFDEEGNILAMQLPLFNFDNGFCLYSVDSLEKGMKLYEDYQQFCEAR